MAGLIRYILLANLFLILIALFYHLVLARETWFKANRFVLLAGTLASLAVPFFKFTWLPTGSYSIFSIPEIIISAKSGMAHFDLEEIQIFGTAPYSFPWLNLFGTIYITGIIITGIILLWKIKTLQLWTRQYPMKWFNDLYITLLPSGWSPFSFLGVVYFPLPLEKADANTRMILEHEKMHIKQRHSWDIVFIEIVKIVFFYNPAVYTIQKLIQANHEYSADSAVVGKETNTYSNALICCQMQAPQFQFIQQFNQTSFLKRRLLMLIKKKTRPAGIFKYLLLTPLAAVLLWFSACTDEAEPVNRTDTPLTSEIKANTSKSAFDIYAESIISADYSELNKWEKQTKAVATEMEKSGATPEEVMTFVNGRITSWVTSNSELIESSIVFKSAGLDLKDFDRSDPGIKSIVEPEMKTSKEEGDVFYIVETMPQFNGGGLEEFRNWVQSNVKYPDIAVENGISGTVFISFIIDKEGKITSTEIVRGVDPSLDNEVKRVLSIAPDWIPGMQRGKNVKVKMALPIKFALN